MSKTDNLKDYLTDIADAVRSKKGTSDPINAQDLSEEIRNLPESGGKWAVDFGEEIASNNSYTLNALQEDIDYYNQIQEERRLYAEGKGGRRDDLILVDPEFHEKIAWWPKGMPKDTSVIGKCLNLREMDGWVMSNYSIFNIFIPFKHMGKLRVDANNSQSRIGYFLNKGSVEDFEVSFPNVTEINTCFYNYTGKTAKVSFPICEKDTQSLFWGVRGLRKLHLETPKVKILSNCVRECNELTELFWDVSSAETLSYCCYNFNSLEICNIYGLKATLSLHNHPSITSESVHYIIQNANGGTADAPITLTLHATAKANWEASEYYAEDVIKAQELNITIA